MRLLIAIILLIWPLASCADFYYIDQREPFSRTQYRIIYDDDLEFYDIKIQYREEIYKKISARPVMYGFAGYTGWYDFWEFYFLSVDTMDGFKKILKKLRRIDSKAFNDWKRENAK